MDGPSIVDAAWRFGPVAVLVLGLALVWRGLAGGRNGQRGLLRTQQPALGRCEGWRVLLVGLVVVGLGAAWQWDSRALLALALGIGFVELWEASFVISVWKRGESGGHNEQPTANSKQPLVASR